MHLKKRETSVSVTDYHLMNMSDSIKKLAIARNGQPYAVPSISPPKESNHVLTVMSNARDDFNARYEVVREIGKGGFSTVYQCRNRSTNIDYAVKVIDLRPLRLRERFNPARLKREVDIMRRLRHPNIIQFVEVYEDADHLMMVMEYCPGHELFDVILARRFFKEEDARPIFAQIARALYYLHTLNIIHRDVKPENVLILEKPNEQGQLVAKLLDFGLSKNANGGSAAKTFVGTPCYLAPEVEYTSKGLGGTYGLPADCWSLGAVLYVMLVARFPEFEQDNTGKVVVKLPPVLWNHISNDAKDLIRGLMNTNPNARMTMTGVLQHPWLGIYRATSDELTSVAVSNSDLYQHLQEEENLIHQFEHDQPGEMEENMESEMTATGAIVTRHAMVLRNDNIGTSNTTSTSGANKQINPEQLQLAPLLHLQRSIATCFEEAHAQYHMMPEVSAQVRKGAVLCRTQLVESTKMLRKVEQTAREVLNMFPDLELAIEEAEPQLAAEFFNIVRGWIVELRELVGSTQKLNKASMMQIQKVVEISTVTLAKEKKERYHHHVHHHHHIEGGGAGQAVTLPGNTVNVSKKLLEDIMLKLKVSNQQLASVSAPTAEEDNIVLDSNQVLELFMTLFSSIPTQSPPAPPTSVTSPPNPPAAQPPYANGVDLHSLFNKPPVPSKDSSSSKPQPLTISASSASDTEEGLNMEEDEGQMVYHSDDYPGASSPRAAQRLAEALQKLRQVDIILEQLSIFWANTEVVLDLLTKKGQHVEQFIHFSSKPRLMARFKERLEEYKRFWEGIQMMCGKYVQGIRTANEEQRMYGFLEGERENSSAGGSEGGVGVTVGAGGGDSMEKNDSLDSFNSSFFGDSTPTNHHMNKITNAH